jgi:hypothetical protein
MDLSGFGSTCNLNFFYAGASRSANSAYINDSLYIDYTINKGTTWVSLAKLGKSDIFNKGTISTAFTPTSEADWAPKSLPLPAAAISKYTTFRFRMRPGVNGFGISSGNNFYMDRIHFSPWPAEVANVKSGTANVVVAPNPTTADAFVIIKGASNTEAVVSVSDITGKVIFSVSEQIKGNQARVMIPGSAIAVKGVYLVRTQTGTQVSTQKLVVY